MRSANISAVLLCLLALPSYAWHAAGHRLTAEIAYELLGEEMRQHVIRILREHPRFGEDFLAYMPDDIQAGSEHERARWLMGQAANWPDQLDDLDEAFREQYHRSTWHYINRPILLAEEDAVLLDGLIQPNVSTDFSPPLRPGLNIVQALIGNLLAWRDANASDADKAVALCWILHLTGDLHQPLHNVALYSARHFPEGDRGGNLIGILRAKRNTNLHAVWDGLANRFGKLVPNQATRNLLKNGTVNIESIAGWSLHYRDYAAKSVYSTEVRQKLRARPSSEDGPTITLSRDYIESAGKFAESQIIIAGHRIAALLDD